MDALRITRFVSIYEPTLLIYNESILLFKHGPSPWPLAIVGIGKLNCLSGTLTNILSLLIRAVVNDWNARLLAATVLALLDSK